MENWLPVVGFEGLYEVSDHGNVKNYRTGKIKSSQKMQRTEHRWVMLWRGNSQKNMRVHRLVLIAFKGHPPDGHECRHLDGNAANNVLTNLCWGTPTENQADRALHGTSNRGEQCAAAKLTEDQVRAIKKDPRLQRIIAKEYGVLPAQISRIKAGLRWAHVV